MFFQIYFWHVFDGVYIFEAFKTFLKEYNSKFMPQKL